jgi:hypothetical protein
MATLETQYKNYKSSNPTSTFTFEEWKDWHGLKLKMAWEEMERRKILKNPKMIDINNKYVVRLRKEWEQHGKIIIGVDYDDTISPWKWTKEELLDTVKVIKEAQSVGAYVVIFTACSKERYPEISAYTTSLGIRVDAINQNPIDIPYGNENKIYANIFLDDRAGLEEAKDILSTCIYLQRSYNRSQIHLDDIG